MSTKPAMVPDRPPMMACFCVALNAGLFPLPGEGFDATVEFVPRALVTVEEACVDLEFVGGVEVGDGDVSTIGGSVGPH